MFCHRPCHTAVSEQKPFLLFSTGTEQLLGPRIAKCHRNWSGMCSHRARVLCSLCPEKAISSWINTGSQDFIFCFIRKIDPPAMSASWYCSHPGRLKGHWDRTWRRSNLLFWVFHTDFRITPCVKTELPVTRVPRYSPMPFLGHLLFLLTPFLCYPRQLTCFRKTLNLTYLLWQEITSSVSHNCSTRSFPAGEVWWLGCRWNKAASYSHHYLICTSVIISMRV